MVRGINGEMGVEKIQKRSWIPVQGVGGGKKMAGFKMFEFVDVYIGELLQ